jgi:CheY-like chemotaxis protein
LAKKILFVDDEVEVVEIVQAKLQNDGYQVVISHTGREGIIQARAHLPDMILMDIVLPDMDGADAVKELHDHNATVGIPVLFLSGIVGGGQEAEINVGGRVYKAMGKPFTYAQLKQRIDHILALTPS